MSVGVKTGSALVEHKNSGTCGLEGRSDQRTLMFGPEIRWWLGRCLSAVRLGRAVDGTQASEDGGRVVRGPYTSKGGRGGARSAQGTRETINPNKGRSKSGIKCRLAGLSSPIPRTPILARHACTNASLFYPYHLRPLRAVSALEHDVIAGTPLSETILEPAPASGFERSFPQRACSKEPRFQRERARAGARVSHGAGIGSGCESKRRTPPVAGGAR